MDCFADDRLEIAALNNEPGVYSARYAGEDKNSQANMEKVLRLMKDKQDRSAQFRTAISLILDGKKYLFEGIIRGQITTEKRGEARLRLRSYLYARRLPPNLRRIGQRSEKQNKPPCSGGRQAL